MYGNGETMHNTIAEHVRNRLVAQADEAEVQGLTKIAEHLTNQIEKNDVRPTENFYSYAEYELENDVENILWNAAIRVIDFHDRPFNAVDVYEEVNRVAKELVTNLRIKIGAIDGVGAFEPDLLGEEKGHVSIELLDNE
jgi:hypothetical protein